MRAIDAVTADYQARKQQHIDVPEWLFDGAPLRIFWDLLTIERRKQLAATSRTDADVVFALARDDTGQPLFTLEDKAKLKLAADAAIISRIATAMLGLAPLTDEAIETTAKN